ncbi:diguanylate cyclase [Rhodobacterales bacterium]|nr:diguanylate cyclase [Rhodobacterales bacterium]
MSLILSGGVLAMVYLFLSTTRSADTLALHHERALVTEALRHSLELEAQHQTFVAVNDKTVREVQVDDRLDPAFAEEIARQMWFDFQHDWTLIVDPRDRLILVAAEDDLVPASAGQDILTATFDLIEEARQGYLSARRPSREGYKVRYVEKGRLAPIYATDIRDISGQPALVSAMAIVPESDHLSLPDGPPGVIVSISLVEEGLLTAIAQMLLLSDFSYIAGPDAHAATVPVTERDGQVLGHFEWHSAAPGTLIRRAIAPIACLLVVAFVTLGVLFARRLAAKSRALEESEARNRRLATHDLMTGLANRTHFHDAFDRAIAECQTCPCAVLAIDLDRFKEVNDTYGHDAGDMVLRQVSQRLKTVLDDHALVARTGGDEFMALLTGDVSDGHVGWLCDALIEAIEQPVPVSGGVAQVGVSIGWASAPKHADTAAHLINLADRALYFAKENGRNMAACVEDIYQPEDAPEASLDKPIKQLA